MGYSLLNVQRTLPNAVCNQTASVLFPMTI